MQEEVAKYSGPHQIHLRQNSANNGLASHINQAFDIASGEIFVIAAGDDVSIPERTQALHELYATTRCVAAFSNAMIINAQGISSEPWFDVAWTPDFNRSRMKISFTHTPMVLGATNSIRRSVWTSFTQFGSDVQQEDVILALRSRLLGEIGYTAACLVNYRRHDTNLYCSTTLSISVTSERQERNRGAIHRHTLEDLSRARSLETVSAVGCLYYRAAIWSTAHLPGPASRSRWNPTRFLGKVLRFFDRRLVAFVNR